MGVLISYIVGFLICAGVIMWIVWWAIQQQAPNSSPGLPTYPVQPHNKPQSSNLDQSYDQMIDRQILRDIRSNTKD